MVRLSYYCRPAPGLARSVFLLIILLAVNALPSAAQTARPASQAAAEAQTLDQLLRSKASPALLHVLDNPDSFRYQLIYTRIDRDKQNRPHFQYYRLRVSRNEYFNPASTVKLPLAFLAVEKVDSLKKYGVDRDTPMLTDSAYGGQSMVYTDSSSANGLPSVAQYIRKIFLVSDNDAYTRLYEFLGQETINRRLWQLGYPDIRITRRFVPMDEEHNRHTNPIRFERNGQTLYSQPPAFSQISFDFSRPALIGSGYLDRHDSLIHAPMDFTRHNNFPLEDGQQLLQSLLFPLSVPETQRLRISADDRKFLLQYMSEYPRESAWPKYDTAEFFDSYAKFLFKAGRSPIPASIRIFNKPGWAYGFLTDIAYFVDFDHRVEFMLSGTIYTNRDGILNDDKYDYDAVGYPFFQEVGRIIYDYELARKRKNSPDLSEFRFDYH